MMKGRISLVFVLALAIGCIFIVPYGGVEAESTPVYGSSAEPYGGMDVSYTILEDGATYYVVRGSPIQISFYGIDARGMETHLNGSGLVIDYTSEKILGQIEKSVVVTIADKTFAIQIVEGVYGNYPIFGAATESYMGSFPDAYIQSPYNKTLTGSLSKSYSGMYPADVTELESYGLTVTVTKTSSAATAPTTFDIKVSGTPNSGSNGKVTFTLIGQNGSGLGSSSVEWTYDITIKDEFIFNFDACGGTAEKTSETVQYGSTITLPSATREGYSFQGWYTQASGGSFRGNDVDPYDPISHYTVAQSPITFYAQWVENEIPVTSITISGSSSVEVGEQITLTARTYPNDAKTRHVDWYIDSGSSYVKIIDAPDTTTGGRCIIEGKAEGTAKILAVARDGSGVEKSFTISVSETVTSYSYTLNYDTDGGTPSIPAYTTSSDSTQISTSVSSTNVTKSGYTFKGWTTTPGDTYIDYAPGAQITLNPGTTTLHAVWEKIDVTWALSFDANGGSGAPSPVTAPVAGTQYTFTIPTKVPTLAGHTFTGWARSVTSIGTYQPGGEFTAYEQNSILYAIWEKEIISNTFTLLFEDSTSDAVSGMPGRMDLTSDSATYSTNIPSAIPIRAGYNFAGWGEIAGTSTVAYQPGDEITLNPGSRTLFAVWTQTSFALTLDSNGGSTANRVITQNGVGECIVTIPDDYKPVRDGYTFQGWSTSRNGGVLYNPGDEITLTASSPTRTLYASWTETTVVVEYSLTFNANGGTGAPGTLYADSTNGSTVTFNIPSTQPTRSGYTFLGWSNLSNASSAAWAAGGNFTPTQVNSTLYAVWKAQVNTWTLHFSANGGYGAPESLSKSVAGQSCTFTIPSTTPTYDGRSFLGWASTFDSTTIVAHPDGAFLATSRNTTLYAVWSAPITQTFHLYFEANGGTDAPEKLTGDGLAPYSFTIPTIEPVRDGYEFIGWATSSTSTTVVVDVGGTYVVTDVMTHLYAVWERVTVEAPQLIFDANGGTGAPGRLVGTNAGANTFTIPATKPFLDGFTFVGWAIAEAMDFARYQPGDEISIAVTTTLYAVWDAIVIPEPPTIGFDANGGTGAPAEIVGETTGNNRFTIPSTEPVRDGFEFVGWATQPEATDAEYQPGSVINTSAPIILHAVWKPLVDDDLPTLSFDANGGTSAPADLVGSVEGDNVFIIPQKKPVRDGYLFVGWAYTENASTPNYYPGQSLSISSSLELHAVWKSIDVAQDEPVDNGGMGLSTIMVLVLLAIITLFFVVRFLGVI